LFAVIICQVTPSVSHRHRKRDSLLAHCIARAVIHEQGGIDVAVETYGPKAERLSKWAAVKAAAKVTPKASRVAAFIVMWTAAMVDESVDEFSITAYERYWHEGERQTYRLQNEFRELWPEFETPNELAQLIINQVDAKMNKRDIATLPSRLMVTA
jgi:hypothetical protein